MSRSRIGGALTCAALAALTEHRPSDPALLAREAAALAALGLTHADIASALRLSPASVAQLLGEQAAPSTMLAEGGAGD